MSSDEGRAPARKREPVRRKKRRLFTNFEGDSSGDEGERIRPVLNQRSTLPPPSRELLLQRKRIQDPFSKESQEVFGEFVEHVNKIEKKDVDLPEMGLLLEGAGRIYRRQVEQIAKDIDELQEHCRRTQQASSELKKKKKLKDTEEKEKEKEGSQTEDESVAESVSADENSEEMEGIVPKIEPEEEKKDLTEGQELHLGGGEGESEESSEIRVDEASAEDGETNEETTVTEETANADQAEEKGPEGDDGAAPNAAEENEESPKKKKPKNGVCLPPNLLSCYDELKLLEEAGFFDDREENHLHPPLLSKAVRLLKRKIYIEDNIPLKKAREDFDFSRSSTPDPSREDSAGSNLDKSTPDVKKEIWSGFSLSQEFPSAISASFSAEDQAAIQECINELHYMPFTFGLTKNDLTSAFSKTVDRMSQIFKKNNVPVTSGAVKEAVISKKAKSAEPTSSKSSPNTTLHPVAHNLGDIYNTLVKMCREECESYLTNTSRSFLERAKERSFAESRANIRAMIAELQKNIVPKFARVPLMAENTPEFFLHVTNFEKKMKKILEEEAKKEEFDVRKYEREVLELTAKESSELDRCEEFVVPTSPTKSLSIDSEPFEASLPSPSPRSSLDGSQSSSTGNSWVPLKHIFQHMKSYDRTETARSFYAVLALLSYQNLDINYDSLFSEECAKLLKKQPANVDLDSRFPRGAKILTSRCPDADKEEVYVAALTAESRDEAFRHLLAQEAQNLASKDGATAADTSSEVEESVAEAMSHFVEESSTSFSGHLHSKRARKKTGS